MSKKVYQFDLEGNIIATYGGVREAERITSVLSSSIVEVCSGKRRQANGFGWSYTPEFHYNDDFSEKFKKGAFLMYDLQGNFIRRFENSKELKDAGFNQISCNRVCRGERKSYKGYIFEHEKVAND